MSHEHYRRFRIVTYLGLSLGKVPWLRIDRAGIALVGATLMMVSGILPLTEAVRSVNYETIILLFGMMVVVGFLRLSEFFDRLAHSTLDHFRTPYGLLALTITLSGVLSAFLVNDIVCIALTPLVIQLARRLQINPLPHLIGPCYRRKYRFHGDPYRQPAEHDYWQLVAYPLPAVRCLSCSGCSHRTGD